MMTDATSTFPTRRKRIPISYAHRGARAHTPENTLLAFELAFDLGADGIECDVQRSRDGHLVIFHDGTVNRTTDGAGLVAAKSFADLRALNAGRRWGIPQRIPTLAETLEVVWRRGGTINLEIKGESEAEAIGTAEAVAPMLAALEDAQRERLLVSSFTHPAVAAIKRQMPSLRVAALYGDREWRKRDMIATAQQLGAEAIHPGVSLTTPELVRQAHDAGLRVNVWTANRWSTIARLIGWGVDGLFSDSPERVIIARARLAATNDYPSTPGNSTTNAEPSA